MALNHWPFGGSNCKPDFCVTGPPPPLLSGGKGSQCSFTRHHYVQQWMCSPIFTIWEAVGKTKTFPEGDQNYVLKLCWRRLLPNGFNIMNRWVTKYGILFVRQWKGRQNLKYDQPNALRWFTFETGKTKIFEIDNTLKVKPWNLKP